MALVSPPKLANAILAGFHSIVLNLTVLKSKIAVIMAFALLQIHVCVQVKEFSWNFLLCLGNFTQPDCGSPSDGEVVGAPVKAGVNTTIVGAVVGKVCEVEIR